MTVAENIQVGLMPNSIIQMITKGSNPERELELARAVGFKEDLTRACRLSCLWVIFVNLKWRAHWLQGRASCFWTKFLPASPVIEIAIISDLVQSMRKDGMTFLIVGHDLPALEPLIDHTIAINQGAIIAEGQIKDVLADDAVNHPIWGVCNGHASNRKPLSLLVKHKRCMISRSQFKKGIIGLAGANGAGKSTLLDSIMGLTQTTGTITINGKSTQNMTTGDIVKNGVGYAPERFNLFPFMTVRDNLMVGAYTARQDIAANLAMVHKLFPRLEERAKQETASQSGGERQMVSLGRALMSSPRLLLVDEPTIGLAPKVCLEIADVLKRLRDEFSLTVLITEQNANFALNLAEEVHVLESGKLVASGTSEELSNDERLAAAYFAWSNVKE